MQGFSFLCTTSLLLGATFGGVAFYELVHRDADENHATDHRELGLRGNVEEKNRILYHLDHRRPADDAPQSSLRRREGCTRRAPLPQWHTTRKSSRTSRVGPNSDPAQTASRRSPPEASKSYRSADDHPIRIDAAETRRFLVSPQRQQVASVDRFG